MGKDKCAVRKNERGRDAKSVSQDQHFIQENHLSAVESERTKPHEFGH